MTGPQSHRVVMLIEQSWPGLYMSAHLAKAGLLCAVIVQEEPLDNARWSLRGLRRAAQNAGWLPGLQAFVGFRHGILHAFNRIRTPAAHPLVNDLRQWGVLVHRVRHFKSEDCRELLRSLAPDITVICGTPILPESLLSIARICTLNTHTSLLPHYRGGGSLFWPLFFRDISRVGFTIHKAVAQVDAGPYLHQEAITVSPADTPQTLLRRSFVRASDVMTELLRHLPSDSSPFKHYEKPLAYSWRSPHAAVRRYADGSTLRQRVLPLVQRAVWTLTAGPRRADARGITVFYFHRALANDTPPTDFRRVLGHPTIDELREKLLYLKQSFKIIPARKALELIDGHEPLTEAYAVVTADDGYRDFRTNFLPLAEELNVPATLFVCTGAIKNGSVWFQRLYDLISDFHSDRLYLPWADCRIHFGEVEHRVLTIERVISPYIKRLTRMVRRDQLDAFFESNPIDAEPDSRDAFCDTRDLEALSASPLIELHLHSDEHDPYETLTDKELEDDVKACMRFFSEQLRIESTVLSYPNGRSKSDQAPVLARLGIKHAFSTLPGVEDPQKTRPYSILRTGMTNEPMASFHWNLRKLIQG